MLNRLKSVMTAILALVILGSVPGAGQGTDQPVELKFTEFYVDDFSVNFSDKLKSLAGKQVLVRGFMAPPLSASGEFMVLTREPVQLCPYCESDADWPRDTLVVYLRDEPRYAYGQRMRIAGVLDVGSKTDERTGFVSQVRLVGAEILR